MSASAPTIAELRAGIVTRVEALVAEARALEAVVAAIDGVPTTPAVNRLVDDQDVPALERPRTRRRRRSTRRAEALERIKAAGTDGVTIEDLARDLGIKPNYLYRVVPELVAEGLVARANGNRRPSRWVAR